MPTMPPFPEWMARITLSVAFVAPSALGQSSPTTAPVPASYQQGAPIQPENWSPARAALGKKLFADGRLSRDGSIACSTCHDPARAFADGSRTATGVRGQVGPRNTPTLVNRALGEHQFWDGRAGTLEEQALGPITNPGEMDLSAAEAVARVAADARYRAAFKQAFGGPPTAARIAAALAAYERTLYSVDAPFDRFLAGDTSAMSPAAQRGLQTFVGKARCAECHSGSNFSDERFHCLGLPGDPGRARVNGARAEDGHFKTPTLRDVARTAPYMHDGSLASLAEVIELYDRGGDPHPNLDPKMAKLGLSAEEKQDLVAFMQALSGSIVEFDGRSLEAGP